MAFGISFNASHGTVTLHNSREFVRMPSGSLRSPTILFDVPPNGRTATFPNPASAAAISAEYSKSLGTNKKFRLKYLWQP
jgi:hypothetical protein